MPRRTFSPANPLDALLQLMPLFFGRGPGAAQKAAFTSMLAVVVLTIGTGGWYVLQPKSRKQEIGRTVANYSQHHKNIRVTELLWDIWTQYFRRPFVPTQVQGGENIVFGGEPHRAAFPYEIRTLYNTAYTVGYCEELEDPAWVGYRVFDVGGHPKLGPRPRSFFLDPRTSARVEPGDYTSSGYDRGHMAPNYAIGTRFGQAAQEETFKMSNVCPQRHRLNAGLWKDLELKVAENYTGRYGQVWVIDGPVFGPFDRLRRLRDKVAVPDAFYMIVLQQHEGGVRAEAFIMNQETPASGALDPYLTTISEIERQTGLGFFPKLEPAARAALENQSNGVVW